MIEGRTLQDFAAEIQRQQAAKHDFKCPAKDLEVVPRNGSSVETLTVGDLGTFPLRDTAHGNLATYTEIPRRYYDRIRKEAPALWADNVNHWLGEKDEPRLVRILDGHARAVLSNRYRIIDNFDMSEAAFPVLQEVDARFGGLEYKSCQVTERRMYIQTVTPMLSHTLQSAELNDVVQAGVTITNSEIGSGAFRVEPLIYRLKCKNGMILPDAAMRKYHIGRAGIGVEDCYEVFGDGTIAADNKALRLKIQDIIRAAFDDVQFQKVVARLEATTDRMILKDREAVVTEVTKAFRLTETERGGVLAHLAEGGDMSQWGLANAVTRIANGAGNYDRAVELEKIGGVIAFKDEKEWKALAA